MIYLSRRDMITVTYKEWAMTCHPSGAYTINKKGKEVAHGQYDAIIAGAYFDEMSKDDAIEALTSDLKDWSEKIKK
jgi:hypothetical protein